MEKQMNTELDQYEDRKREIQKHKYKYKYKFIETYQLLFIYIIYTMRERKLPKKS
jgi:hypothetical protein